MGTMSSESVFALMRISHVGFPEYRRAPPESVHRIHTQEKDGLVLLMLALTMMMMMMMGFLSRKKHKFYITAIIL